MILPYANDGNWEKYHMIFASPYIVCSITDDFEEEYAKEIVVSCETIEEAREVKNQMRKTRSYKIFKAVD